MKRLQESLERFTRAVNKGTMFLALIFLVVMVVALFVQVFTRYVLNDSLTGTEEIARYTFVWCTMLGAGLCVANDDHAAVTLLNDMLKGKAKCLHKRCIDVIVLICGVLLFVQGIKMVLLTYRQLTPSLQIPMAVVYLSLVVGAAVIIVNSINNLVHRENA